MLVATSPVARGELPQPPDGWRLDVVLEAPAIRHPTVVCAAPDGRVFVAEDPMDIATESAAATEGRILCLHPGGRVTTFADKLHAVFGMQYIDGRLFVLHNPRFSVFTVGPDGSATRREELIESTHPEPWALNWNDHVPANFRLAMDGYLYVSVGDKGMYNAVGRDGRRLDHRGGGIVRLRPDGTGLETWASGTRNHLDVAMTDEDEIFTYDNTDEQQWMGRLTHMVDGGFYGYPYDFTPRRPYTLWMMHDFGGGAATGAFCYTDDALPPDYRGDLFLADFEKRQVLRVKVKRSGATFEVASHESFFKTAPPDFRPVGIAPMADGMGFWICDWQHEDTKEKVTVGRLLRATYTGKSHAASRPAWYVPAAAGQKFEATVEELIEALEHPSRDIRMVAQRRVAERGREAVESLTALLSRRAAPAVARSHALWALNAIDGGVAARTTILSAVSDPDAAVRRQVARFLGTREVPEAIAALRKQLRIEPDASVRFHATAALGRIGSHPAVLTLRDELDQSDLFARYAAFTALKRIGRRKPTHWELVVRSLASQSPRQREGTVFALRDEFDPALVAALIKLSELPAWPLVAKRSAVELLARMHHRAPEWSGEWWAYHPVNAPPPARDVRWEGTEAVLRYLRGALNDPDREIRLTALRGIAEAGDRLAGDAVRALLGRTDGDRDVRSAAMAALAAIGDPSAPSIAADLITDPTADAALVSAAIAAAERIGAMPQVATALCDLLGRPAPSGVTRHAIRAAGVLKLEGAVDALAVHARAEGSENRTGACAALAAIGSKRATAVLLTLVDANEDAKVRLAAVRAIGEAELATATPKLREVYAAAPAGSELRTAVAAALAAMPEAASVDAYLDGLGGRNADLRERCRAAIAAIAGEVRTEIERRVPTLPPAAVLALRGIYENDKIARGGPIFTMPVKGAAPADYFAFARDNRGDPSRGRAVFADAKGAGCIRCHSVGAAAGGQSTVGPDLSTIGAQQPREALAENILFPNKTVREGYAVTVVRLKPGGRAVSGSVKTESAEELVLLDSDGKLHRVPKSKIDARRSTNTSAMPEGLHAGLSLEQFADLVAYLESLKGDGSTTTTPTTTTTTKEKR